MADDPEVIQKQMEETRASLQEKLETLESQVIGTVQGATTAVTDTVSTVQAAVAETVDSVKDGVSGTVEAVKESVANSLDLERQVQEHPWGMMLGALALGFVGGTLLGPGRMHVPGMRRRMGDKMASHGAGSGVAPQAAAPNYGNGYPGQPSHPGAVANFFSGVADNLGPELGRLKGLALGAALGLARDYLTRSAPAALRGSLGEIIDDVTAKLGGKPVQGPILERGPAGETQTARGNDFARGGALG